MGIGDKAKHKLEEMTGKGKAGVGDATDDRDLEAEGRMEETSGQTKQVGDDLKDALRDAGRATKLDRDR